MTDLEDAWERYPTSPAPVADLIQRGRGRRSSRVTLPAIGGLVAAGLAIALAVTLNPGSTSTPGSAGAGPAHPGLSSAMDHGLKLVAFQADLRPAATCDQLLATYRGRGLKLVSAYGWNGGIFYPMDGVRRVPMAGTMESFAPNAASTLATGTPGQANSSTGTNVQEVGVDEPDVVKTNGSLLVRIDGATLAVYTLSGAEPTRVSTLALPYFGTGQILLSGTTVVAFGTDNQPSATGSPSARVATVSLADPASPRIIADVTYAGAITSARQHGSAIRLVLSTGLPNLPFVQPDATGVSISQALAANRRLVAHSTLAQWLPAIDTGSGPHPLLGCGDVAVTPSSVQLGTTSVIGFDADAPTAPSAIGLSGQTSVAYESTDHLYLTGAGTRMGPCACPMFADGRAMGYGANGPTAIFQFDLQGDQAAHVATGTVNGSIADRWSMDEVGGVLRVATTQTSATAQTSSVVTLRRSGSSLVQVGRLDGLGQGETLTAARWFGDYGVIATSPNGQMDPLFTVDLTDAAHPRLLGALHIPGYSSYFHPLGNGLLLGIGQKVTFASSGEQNRAQVGLFDMRDLRHVRRLSVVTLGQWTSATAGNDPHAFTWLPDHSVALTSFSTQRNGIVLGEFKVQGRSLTDKVITVPAVDPSTVRTLELSDGRVVLMAGGSVTFLSL